jgi:WD40 repeat protein
VATSPDGRYLLVLPAVSPIIWDTRTGKPLATLPEAEKSYYYGAAFSPDNRQLAVLRRTALEASRRNTVVQFALGGDKGLASLKEASASINAVAINAAGKYFAVTETRGVQVFNGETLDLVFQTPKGMQYIPFRLYAENSAVFLPALEVSDSASSWKKHKPALIRISLPDGRATALEKFTFEEREPNDHRFQATFAVSPDHQTLAAMREGRVDFYHFSDGSQFASIELGLPVRHPRAQFLAPGRVLLTTDSMADGNLEYDVATGKKLASIPDSDSTIVASPDGDRFAIMRTWAPMENNIFAELSTPLVIVWERTK